MKHTSFLRRLLAISTAGAAFAVAAAPAMAQLEEVIVTARKFEERLQDVPLSVAVFTSEELEQRGMQDIFQLSQFTPGFSFEKVNRYGLQGGVSRPVIRGMSNILGEGNASVFVDGVLYSDSVLSFPFDIVERVEVIKGPQAALFGRATFAGAVNLVTKKGTNEYENKISMRAAEYEDYELNLLSRGPVVQDRLFYMLHGRYYTFDGKFRNALDTGKVGGEESYGVNASLEFRPSERFTGVLSAGFNEDNDGLAAIVLQDRFANNCFLNTPRQYYCGEVQEFGTTALDRAGLQGKEGLYRESARLAATLDFDFDAFTVTSNTGAMTTDIEYGYDSTYQGGTAIAPTTIPGAPGAVRAATDPVRRASTLRNEMSERDEWSTELRVQSRRDARFRLMGGLFYYETRRTLEELHFAATAPTIDFGETRIDNQAVFGSAAVDFTDRWNATAELRYAEDTIGNLRQGVLIERTFDSVSPRVTTSFKLTPNSMLYANVAQGNKPGVINADPRFPPDIQFAEEEESWNYEIGSKNTLLDGRLIANVAAYYIDWTNQQLTTTFFFPTGGTQSFIINAGKSKVRGAELELQGIVNDYLTGGLTVSYNDAEFVELNDPEANDLFGNPSLAGNQLPQAPKKQASVFGRVEFPVAASSRGFVRADAAYVDKKYDQVFNLAHTGEQFIVNLRLGLEREHWDVSLFVDNVTDDRTPSTVTRYVDQMNLNVPQVTNANPAQNNVPGTTTTERAFFYPLPIGRQIGISASYRF